MSRNITIKLDEDLARWVRIHAAERETSVSQLVAEMIRGLMREKEDYDAARRLFLSVEPSALREAGGPYPDRDELYDRPVLRRHQRPRLRGGHDRA